MFAVKICWKPSNEFNGTYDAQTLLGATTAAAVTVDANYNKIWSTNQRAVEQAIKRRNNSNQCEMPMALWTQHSGTPAAAAAVATWYNNFTIPLVTFSTLRPAIISAAYPAVYSVLSADYRCSPPLLISSATLRRARCYNSNFATTNDAPIALLVVPIVGG